MPEVKSADLILNYRQDGPFHNNLWLFVNNCVRTQIIIKFILSLSTDVWVTMFQIYILVSVPSIIKHNIEHKFFIPYCVGVSL